MNSFYMRWIFASILFIGLSIVVQAQTKILQMGYGTPLDQFITERGGEMEQWNSFLDGFVYGIKVLGDCEAKSGNQKSDERLDWICFGKGKVKWSNVEMAVKNINAGKAKFTRPQEMFFRITVVPGNVDWFDDDGWDGISHNAGIVGRIISESKSNGIFLDVEEYGKAKFGQGRPFQFAKQKNVGTKTFEEYAVQAKKRGNEFIKAFQKTAPADSIIIFTWAHSQYSWDAYRREKKGMMDDSYKSAGYLLAPFIDGILEGANESIKFYDGCEWSYGFRNAADFKRAKEFVREGWRYSSVPEIYKKKMKAAFSVELDRQWSYRGGFFPNRPQDNYWTPKTLADALKAAMENSDGYIWVYNERIQFWPPSNFSDAYRSAFSEAKKAKPFGKDEEIKTGITESMVRQDAKYKRASDLRGEDPGVALIKFWNSYDKLFAFSEDAKFKTDPGDVGEREGWKNSDYDDSDWKTIKTTEFWEHQGYADYDGIGWYRMSFRIPDNIKTGKKLFIAFCAADERTIVFINGKKAFEFGSWNQPFLVPISDLVELDKDNILAVKVYGGYGVGGLWGSIALVIEK